MEKTSEQKAGAGKGGKREQGNEIIAGRQDRQVGGSEAPVSRRELRKLENKAAIERASEEIFLEKGYAGASVDEIARIAGVTKRTLYSYYPSKLALFIHVFDEYLQQLTAEIEEAAGGDGTFPERLLAALNALFGYTRRNEKFMLLYWMLDSGESEGVLSKELIDHVKRWTDAMMQATMRMVVEGQEKGYIREMDPKLVVHLMSAVNKGIVVHANKERRFEIEDIDSRSLQETFVEILEGGLLAGGEKAPGTGGGSRAK